MQIGLFVWLILLVECVSLTLKPNMPIVKFSYTKKFHPTNQTTSSKLIEIHFCIRSTTLNFASCSSSELHLWENQCHAFSYMWIVECAHFHECNVKLYARAACICLHFVLDSSDFISICCWKVNNIINAVPKKNFFFFFCVPKVFWCTYVLYISTYFWYQ